MGLGCDRGLLALLHQIVQVFDAVMMGGILELFSFTNQRIAKGVPKPNNTVG